MLQAVAATARSACRRDCVRVRVHALALALPSCLVLSKSSDPRSLVTFRPVAHCVATAGQADACSVVASGQTARSVRERRLHTFHSGVLRLK